MGSNENRLVRHDSLCEIQSKSNQFQSMAVPGRAAVTAEPVGKKIEHTRHASNHARVALQRPICKKNKKFVRLSSFIFLFLERGKHRLFNKYDGTQRKVY